MTAKQDRERLPDGPVGETFELGVGGLRYTATVGRFLDGPVGEIFLNNHKSNSAADTNARDWRQAAADYHHARGQRTLVVEIDPERLARLRRVKADDISLDRVWRELNDPGARPIPQTTVNALLYQLRMDGLAAFEHPNCRRRLAELLTEQLRELIAALIRVRPICAAVTDELLIALDRIGRP
jgi:hypothetical protein